MTSGTGRVTGQVGDTGWYVQTATPTQFQSALGVDIGNSNLPFAASTVEFAGGAHYNNHPSNSTIGHWIPVYGYANSGTTAYFADSATYWSGVNPGFTYTSNSFVNTFMQTNGMAW